MIKTFNLITVYLPPVIWLIFIFYVLYNNSEIKLSEGIQLMNSIFLTVFMTYFYNDQINKKKQKRDLVIEILKDFYDEVTCSSETILTFLNTPQKEAQNTVLLRFKKIRAKIDFISQSEAKNLIPKFDENKTLILENFQEAKDIVTGDTWGKDNLTYNPEQKDKVNKIFSDINAILFKIQLSILE